MHSIFSLILIYVGIRCLLACLISDFKELQKNVSMSNIKHQKRKLNKSYWHMKVNIYEKLTASANLAMQYFQNLLISYYINDISFFDFTVP